MRSSRFDAGPLNAITDVPGVHVGQVSVRDGETNTGVTVVSPAAQDARNGLRFYGKHVSGSEGELTGFQVIDDFGLLSSPVFITNLMSVGRIYNGALTAAFKRASGLPTNGGWPPIVIGIDDRLLNDMRARVLTDAHAVDALATATTGPVRQGNVGAGAGVAAFGYKSGVGTSSRRIVIDENVFHVGVLSIPAHGGFGDIPPVNAPEGDADLPVQIPFPIAGAVVATDAPLSSRQLDSLAGAAAEGLARIPVLGPARGSYIVVSFGTGLVIEEPDDDALYDLSFLSDNVMPDLRQAAVESSEESVFNALRAAMTIRTPAGRFVKAVSDETLRDLIDSRYD